MNGDIRKFKFWCQKVLPLVYDDSLSYYEVLCKIVNYLNKVIEDVNSIPEYIDSVIDERLSDEHLKELMEQFIVDIESAISANNEHDNTNSSADYNIGQMLWWNGKLYKVIRTIDAGDTLIVDTNIELVNFEDLLNDFVDEVKHDITNNDDGSNTIASRNWNIGDWLWLNDVLYAVTNDITEGNAYIFSGVNANVRQITIDEELKAEATTRATADGDLNNLSTTNKDSLVDAINEVIVNYQSADDSINEDINILNNELADVRGASIKSYGASGSDNIYSGSVNGNYVSANSHDFEVGNGLVLEYCGSLPNFEAPTNFGVNVVGTSGSITHKYSIASVSYNGAMSASISITIANCPTTPTADNYVELSWTKQNPNIVDNYAIYRDDTLIGFCNPAGVANGGTITFDDFYCRPILAPVNIPQTPPTSAIRGWLDTVVTAVTENSITIRDYSEVAITTRIYHNDRLAIQNALNNHNAYVPDGTYNVFNYKQHGVYRYNLILFKNSELHGNGSKSIIKNINGYMSLFMLCNAVNAGLSVEADNYVNIHDIVLDGGIADGFMENPKGQFYANTGILFISANGTYYPEHYNVYNCQFKNSCSSTCVFSAARYISVDNCTFENALGGPSVNNNCYGFKFTNNYIMNTGDDAISANAIGIGMYNSNGVIANNVIFNSGSRGIVVQGNNINVVGNTVYMCASSGILAWNLDGGGNLTKININNNNVFGAGKLDAGVNGYLLPTGSIGVGGVSGIMVAGYELTELSALVQGINIVGNIIDYSNDYGIHIYNHGSMYMNHLMVTSNNMGDKGLNVDVLVENQNSYIAHNV